MLYLPLDLSQQPITKTHFLNHDRSLMEVIHLNVCSSSIVALFWHAKNVHIFIHAEKQPMFDFSLQWTFNFQRVNFKLTNYKIRVKLPIPINIGKGYE